MTPMRQPEQEPPCIAVLGLGEAGSEIAADLVAAGAIVRGFDPAVPSPAAGIERCSGEAEAARGAGVVLSVNSAEDAPVALERGAAGASPGTLWADLNTAGPGAKRALAEQAAQASLEFVDVALMSPVPGRGLRTPMLVSGPGASRYALLMGPLGCRIEVLEGPPGAAATRKLLRSVFYKGMAAAVLEALSAARAAGEEPWLREHLADELAAADRPVVDRLVKGSHRHARRRAEEMRAAAALVSELGVPPLISRASQGWLEHLLAADAAEPGAQAGSSAAAGPARSAGPS